MTVSTTIDCLASLKVALASAPGRKPAAVINEIVDFGLAMGEQCAESLLERHPELFNHVQTLTEIYSRYVAEIEAAEERRILSQVVRGPVEFTDVAGAAAMMAYDRVGGMFDFVDFRECRRFVLIGCGRLPVTAFHVRDLTNGPEIVCVDVRPEVVQAAARLAQWLGMRRFDVRLGDGLAFDFTDSDTIYVANMVSPKALVLSRIADTAPEDVRIIVREPYSLGRLWAEESCRVLDARLEIVGAARGSRYLSRDIFVRRRRPLAAGTLRGERSQR